jgi:hypothetical protein
MPTSPLFGPPGRIIFSIRTRKIVFRACTLILGVAIVTMSVVLISSPTTASRLFAVEGPSRVLSSAALASATALTVGLWSVVGGTWWRLVLVPARILAVVLTFIAALVTALAYVVVP